MSSFYRRCDPAPYYITIIGPKDFRGFDINTDNFEEIQKHANKMLEDPEFLCEMEWIHTESCTCEDKSV